MRGLDLQTRLNRIVSGGQTGVDQGALEAAIQLGIDHGGWCPLGRKCETGVISGKYSLTETDSPKYKVRTQQNVIDSDGTLILYRSKTIGRYRVHAANGTKARQTVSSNRFVEDDRR